MTYEYMKKRLEGGVERTKPRRIPLSDRQAWTEFRGRLMRGQGKPGGVSAGLCEVCKRLLCGGMDARIGGQRTILRRIARRRLPARICGNNRKSEERNRSAAAAYGAKRYAIPGIRTKAKRKLPNFRRRTRPNLRRRIGGRRSIRSAAWRNTIPAPPRPHQEARHLPLAGAAAMKKRSPAAAELLRSGDP